MAATAINGIRHSKSGAKAGLVVDGGFAAGWGLVRDMGWCGRRLVLSTAKPNMRRNTNPPAPNRGHGNNRITLNYPIIALIRMFAVNVEFQFEIKLGKNIEIYL
ncbi:hypothetical protein [Aeromonas hydrophila]|uniref:hypothetical protein n=1 Tax=Aeromonas hydrophila TaxID=644 RepID=UPI002B46086B|nr:hypothetical protein [Aeromonas hydrophila]